MSVKGRVITLVIILLILGGSAFWIWNKYTGKYKIGADAIIGCQGSNKISNFLGRPGGNLTSYNLFGRQVSVHEKITPYLDALQKEIADAKIDYSFDEVQTYNYRSKRGGGGQSLHSWGIAIDINPDRNPYQVGNWGEPQTDLPSEVIDIFKKNGFAWGGDWAGQRDSMHFEWYGSQVTGSFVDSQSGQKINHAIALINDSGVHTFDGNFDWTLPATHKHKVVVKAKGYEDNQFDMELFCFENKQMDISLKPLPDNLGGSISGRVSLTGNRPPVIPATILLDGKVVGATNVTGDYMISNVRRGKHRVEAKILFFPSGSIETPDLVPGENIRDLNFSIGG